MNKTPIVENMNKTPIVVIHHSADYDGIFCREIAKQFLPEAIIIGWDYGDPKIPFPDSGNVYLLDLSPDCFTMTADRLPMTANGQFAGTYDRLIWIDHHKSAIEKFPTYLHGWRIDGVAACRLVWQWFSLDPWKLFRTNHPPDKSDFITRRVQEPLAVRLAGEYDIWDHRGDGDLEFQFGLDCLPSNYIPAMLDYSKTAENTTNHAITLGKAAMACYAKRDADMMRTRSFKLSFEGLTLLALNTAKCNSNTFNALDKPETGHDALCAFYYNGRVWRVSLYHASHRKDLDLSQIAVKYGGGGHRGACGFETSKFPFA